MANSADIDQAIEAINKKWGNPPARNGFYRNVLKSVTIKKLRKMSVGIEFTWPVCAIGGTNGSGKSTVLQMCSAAYSQKKGGRYFKIGDWVRAALSGETPAVGTNASVGFAFWDDTSGYLVPHTPARKRWKYPAKAPLRNVEFIGISEFAPRIERRDRVHASRSRLEVRGKARIDDNIMQSISRILGQTYERGDIYTVGSTKAQWTENLPGIVRSGSSYTESHMGAGEQKVVRLVQKLEGIEERSLILLEEPEITLHPDAQRGLAWYLMALSARKGHQIIIATHSSDIFDTLPKEARILLVRNGGAIEALHNVPTLRAARELSRTALSNKSLILVEDQVAKIFLEEMLRHYNRRLLENAQIVPVGNTDDVRRMVKSFHSEGVRCVGVRDGDTGPSNDGTLLSLPGDKSPEELLLDESNLKNTEVFMRGITEAYDRAKATALNLSGSARAKKIFEALPGELSDTKNIITDRLTMAWLANHHSDAEQVVESIQNFLDAEIPTKLSS